MLASQKGGGRTVMLEYRMYVIDNGGRIIERIDLECSNDEEAVEDVKAYALNNDVEIRCRQRLVNVVQHII
jgi:hypothetical protein